MVGIVTACDKEGEKIVGQAGVPSGLVVVPPVFVEGVELLAPRGGGKAGNTGGKGANANVGFEQGAQCDIRTGGYSF